MSDITVRLSPESPAGRKLLRLESKLGMRRTELVAAALEAYYRIKLDESLSMAASTQFAGRSDGDEMAALQGLTDDSKAVTQVAQQPARVAR